MKRLLKVLLFCVFLGPCALFIGWNASQFPKKTAEDEQKRAQAETLIAALWEFQRETGAFPEDLDELEGWQREDSDAPREPRPRFQYQVTESGFTVEFLEAPLGTMWGDGFHRYTSETGEWDLYFP